MEIRYQFSRLLTCGRCATSSHPVPQIGTNLLLYGAQKQSLFLMTITEPPLVPVAGLTPHLIGQIRHIAEKGKVEFLKVCSVEGCGWEKTGIGLEVSSHGHLIKVPKFEILEQQVFHLKKEEFRELINSKSRETREFMFL